MNPPPPSSSSTTTATTRLTRDEYKQRKALEEARKAGTAMPEVDESGRDINPHIPEYIAKAPWYISTGKPTLSHQKSTLRTSVQEDALSKQLESQSKPKNESQRQQQQQKKFVKRVVTKYRDGACENCGAMTHKTRDCLERPRRRGAKLTGKNFQSDEWREDEEENAEAAPTTSFEGKRDRWRGYDASQYDQVFQYHRQLDMERRKKKAAEIALQQIENLNKQEEKSKADVAANNSSNQANNDNLSDSDSDIGDDEDKECDAGPTFANADPRTKSTIRNLRIREDIAKYLINLDEESAHYDPKTRSMRGNPLPQIDPSELVYAGDNVLRHTGEWKDFASIQMYALQAQNKGQEVNFVGAPSQAELSFRTFQERKKELGETRQQNILDEYGGKEYLKKPEEDAALSLHEKEVFVQFARDGRVISSGSNRSSMGSSMKRSKYPEDVYEHGHTSVWGSYWKDGQWGYACCKVMNRTAQCPNEDLLDVAGIAMLPSSVAIPKNEGVSHADSGRKRKRHREHHSDTNDHPEQQKKQKSRESSEK